MAEMKITVSDAIQGDVKIETFEVTKQEADLENMRMAFQPGMGGRFVEPGIYKRLFINGVLMMSNTQAEIRDHSYFVYRAKGKVLINGLGLGVCVQMLLEKPEVKEIIVIEINKDVIDLVGPTYLSDKRVTIIHADALTYKPPKNEKYDFVWHDIWPYIVSDNIPTMSTLHRKYGKRTSWQNSWCRELIKSRS